MHGYGQADLEDLAYALPAAGAVLPDQSGNKGARRPQAVAVEEVKLGCILEGRGSLHQPQAQEARIKIDIALRIRRHQRDVMDAGRHAAVTP